MQYKTTLHGLEKRNRQIAGVVSIPDGPRLKLECSLSNAPTLPSAVVGDAIKDWMPLLAISFKKLDKPLGMGMLVNCTLYRENSNVKCSWKDIKT
ncbi:hypothetical protein L1987_35745 [Smallanthus sonchifolius]|uniref:Uncharacterized protein n=1 Tax=Smallanthus sonchifolius TaxID=185202 RepID=A0ACB9HC93_9ASTR|nr:hypothetical protein L1987_35745 [Smallanthus sonchifolius]